MKHEVSIDLIGEIAECIYDCSWVSAEEIAAYMKSTIIGNDDYEPEEWSVDGKGKVAVDRGLVINQGVSK